MGEGCSKIGQDRGFPKQSPAAGWVEVLGTFHLISPRSMALSKWRLVKYSEDPGSKNYWTVAKARKGFSASAVKLVVAQHGNILPS